jgi:hypothetical protein
MKSRNWHKNQRKHCCVPYNMTPTASNSPEIVELEIAAMSRPWTRLQSTSTILVRFRAPVISPGPRSLVAIDKYAGLRLSILLLPTLSIEVSTSQRLTKATYSACYTRVSTTVVSHIAH